MRFIQTFHDQEVHPDGFQCHDTAPYYQAKTHSAEGIDFFFYNPGDTHTLPFEKSVCQKIDHIRHV